MLPSGAWIDDKLVSDTSDELPVGMPVNDNILAVSSNEPLGVWAPDFIAVAHMHAFSSDFQNDLLAQIRVVYVICVSIHCFYWRDRGQLNQNFVSPYIARVKDEIHPRQRGMYRQPQKPVRIRYQANNRSIRTLHHVPYIT